MYVPEWPKSNTTDIYRTTNFCFQPWTSANGIQLFCLTKDVSSSAILFSKSGSSPLSRNYLAFWRCC